MTARNALRSSVIPYARPYWDHTEATALLAALDSGMWTNGEQVAAFERDLELLTGTPAVTLSSGTGAVWALLHVLGRSVAGPKLLLTPALNFAAGPASAKLLGWDVALCDVRADDLTVDPASVADVLQRVGHRYARIVVLPVHYAGHSAAMKELAGICADSGADLVEDACHAVGGFYTDTELPIGSWPDSLAAYFSFHPTKPIATGEGGAVVTSSSELLTALRAVRNHNMVPVGDPCGDSPWPYTITEPGMNLRLSELHAAVGVAQTARVQESRVERARLAARYRQALAGLPAVRVVPARPSTGSAHHLFPVVFDLAALDVTKADLLNALHRKGIRCQVHYTPLHRLPAFADTAAHLRSDVDVIDAAFPGLVSLPLWRGLLDAEQDRVIDVVTEIATGAHSWRDTP